MMPSRPGAGLVLVQPHVALLRLELRFYAPPGATHVCQGLQGSISGSLDSGGVGQVVAAHVPGQGGRMEQPSVGRQRVSSKAIRMWFGVVGVVASIRCSCFGIGLLSRKPFIPEAQEHFLCPFRTRYTPSFGGLGLGLLINKEAQLLPGPREALFSLTLFRWTFYL